MVETPPLPGTAMTSSAKAGSLVKLISWDQPVEKPTAIVGGAEAIEAALAFGKGAKTARPSADFRSNFQAQASIVIDAGQIFPGFELYYDDYIHLFRGEDGQLWLRPRGASAGIFTKVVPDTKYAVNADDEIYFGDRPSQSMILAAAQTLAVGATTELAAHRTVGRDKRGAIYIIDDGCSLSGTYIKTVQPNSWMAVQTGDTLVHLGRHGIYELSQPINTTSTVKSFVRPGSVNPIDTMPQTKLPVAIKIGLAPQAVADPAINISLRDLRPGSVRRISGNLSVKCDESGRHFAASSLLKDGIFVRVMAAENIYLKANDAIYFGNQRFDAEIRNLGTRLKSGSEMDYSAHRVIGKDNAGHIYMRDDGSSMAGTFIKQSSPGQFVEILPTDEMVHLGPYGQIKIIRA